MFLFRRYSRLSILMGFFLLSITPPQVPPVHATPPPPLKEWPTPRYDRGNNAVVTDNVLTQRRLYEASVNGDAQHTKLRQAWHVPAMGKFAPVITTIDDSTQIIFVRDIGGGGDGGTIKALKAADGEPYWTEPYKALHGIGAITTSRIATDPKSTQALFFGTSANNNQGIFYAIAATDQHLLWERRSFGRRQPLRIITSSPAVTTIPKTSRGLALPAVFFMTHDRYGSGGDTLYALYADTGDPLWPPLRMPFKCEAPTITSASIESTNSTPVILLGCLHYLQAINAITGTPFWPAPVEIGSTTAAQTDEISGQPAATTVQTARGDIPVIFFGTEHGRFYAIDVEKRLPLWIEINAGTSVYGFPAIADIPMPGGATKQVVFFGGEGGQLSALDAASGQQFWPQRFIQLSKKRLSTSPTIALPSSADATHIPVIFVGTSDTNLYAINAQNGDILENILESYPKGDTTKRFDSSPVVLDGSLYIGMKRGVGVPVGLYAFRPAVC